MIDAKGGLTLINKRLINNYFISQHLPYHLQQVY